MSARKPTPAGVSSALPSLIDLRRAALITGGSFGALTVGLAAVPKQAPVCADTRVGELRAHGGTLGSALTRQGPGAAMHEIALAVGLAQHNAPPPQIEHLPRPGEMMPVGPTPPPTVSPVVPPVVEAPVMPQGAPPPVTEIPPEPPRARHPARPHPQPPRVRPAGGAPSVGPGELK